MSSSSSSPSPTNTMHSLSYHSSTTPRTNVDRGMIVDIPNRMEGKLSKWTNYASGYKQRWFILENGMLSYYKSPSDYPSKCRGSISLRNARISIDKRDKHRFEILDSGYGVKYNLKADTSSEAKKWVTEICHMKQKLLSFTYPNAEPSYPKPQLDENIEVSTDNSSPITQLSLLSGYVSTNYPHDQTILQLVNKLSTALQSHEIENQQSSSDSEEEFYDATNGDAQISPQTTNTPEHEYSGTLPSLVPTNEDSQPIDNNSQLNALPSISLISSSPVVNLQKKSITRPLLPEEFKNSLVGYPDPPRSLLPENMCVDASSVSIWTVLKSCINKDIGRVTVPIHYNEPLSMLQRLSEEMEYAELLYKADVASDSVNRLMLVAAFAASGYSNSDMRISKPFNPLLGETFEYVDKEKGFRYIAEQVSHHPPISACHCESENYIYWSEVNIKANFWGKSFEVTPLGTNHLILKGSGEHYSWKKVHTVVHNIIIGKLWLDHYGTMTIRNHTTGEVCQLDFKAAGWRGHNAKRIEGSVLDMNGNVCYEIYGHWNDKLVAKKVMHSSTGKRSTKHEQTNQHENDENECILWKVEPRPLESPKMYNMTKYAMRLNELATFLQEKIAPTDSRLRPDQRAMENGDLQSGIKLKNQLEQKQRSTRKEKEKAMQEQMKQRKAKSRDNDNEEYDNTEESISSDITNHDYQDDGTNKESFQEHGPRWFIYDPVERDTGEPQWIYRGGYWEARNSGKWDRVPNIYL